MISYSVGWFYRFAPEANRSLFVHPEFGFTSAKVTGANDDLKNHTYFKIGLGVFQYTASSFNVRFELNYRIVFSKGTNLDKYIDQIYDNAEGIGLDLTFGIPIKKRE
jgi:hypothetical protein